MLEHILGRQLNLQLEEMWGKRLNVQLQKIWEKKLKLRLEEIYENELNRNLEEIWKKELNLQVDARKGAEPTTGGEMEERTKSRTDRDTDKVTKRQLNPMEGA